MSSNVQDAVKLIECHVDASSLINGVKALHLSSDSVKSFDDWPSIASELERKGYEVRGKNFISASRLGHGEYVGVEISRT